MIRHTDYGYFALQIPGDQIPQPKFTTISRAIQLLASTWARASRNKSVLEPPFGRFFEACASLQGEKNIPVTLVHLGYHTQNHFDLGGIIEGVSKHFERVGRVCIHGKEMQTTLVFRVTDPQGRREPVTLWLTQDHANRPTVENGDFRHKTPLLRFPGWYMDLVYGGKEDFGSWFLSQNGKGHEVTRYHFPTCPHIPTHGLYFRDQDCSFRFRHCGTAEDPFLCPSDLWVE